MDACEPVNWQHCPSRKPTRKCPAGKVAPVARLLSELFSRPDYGSALMLVGCDALAFCAAGAADDEEHCGRLAQLG